MKGEALVRKVWGFCNTLRDDGVSYGEYLEQLTFLLFLKMAYEGESATVAPAAFVPASLSWSRLIDLQGARLEKQYAKTLKELGELPGMLGAIFHKAHNQIQDAAKLAKLISLINGQDWLSLDGDTKGDLYEGLLQKNAEDVKSGAGQYFTPRAVTQAMVACVRPAAMKRIADPACGTGGFFLAAKEWLEGRAPWIELNRDWLDPQDRKKLTRRQDVFLKQHTFSGNEIVASTRRLCLMNLALHGIGDMQGEPLIERSDALASDAIKKVDYVFANPPFGKKSSIKLSASDSSNDAESLTYDRTDFWETTSNKQLGFLQHIVNMLDDGGEAAVVLPDNVLFESGAGERIRRRLLQTVDLHTVLRLPTGIFYAQGVKANVLFFRKSNAVRDPNVDRVWFYDLRTNMRFTLKSRPLQLGDLRDFIVSYKTGRRHERVESDRFRSFSSRDLLARDRASLDVFWLKDSNLTQSDVMPSVEQLQREIVDHLEAALLAFRRTMGREPSAGIQTATTKLPAAGEAKRRRKSHAS